MSNGRGLVRGESRSTWFWIISNAKNIAIKKTRLTSSMLLLHYMGGILLHVYWWKKIPTKAIVLSSMLIQNLKQEFSEGCTIHYRLYILSSKSKKSKHKVWFWEKLHHCGSHCSSEETAKCPIATLRSALDEPSCECTRVFPMNRRRTWPLPAHPVGMGSCQVNKFSCRTCVDTSHYSTPSCLTRLQLYIPKPGCTQNLYMYMYYSTYRLYRTLFE